MDDFAYSRIENWFDKDCLFKAAERLIKKIAKSSAIIAGSAAIATASAAQMSMPVEAHASVTGYEISSSVASVSSPERAPDKQRVAKQNFDSFDALIARMDADQAGFDDPMLAALAESAASAVKANENQTPAAWAKTLLSNIKII